MGEFVVYILSSYRANKLYTGHTSDLISRIRSHNEFGKGWTARYRPWHVIYMEFYATKKEALCREKWLKSGVGREFIAKNIKFD